MLPLFWQHLTGSQDENKNAPKNPSIKFWKFSAVQIFKQYVIWHSNYKLNRVFRHYYPSPLTSWGGSILSTAQILLDQKQGQLSHSKTLYYTALEHLHKLILLSHFTLSKTTRQVAESSRRRVEYLCLLDHWYSSFLCFNKIKIYTKLV